MFVWWQLTSLAGEIGGSEEPECLTLLWLTQLSIRSDKLCVVSLQELSDQTGVGGNTYANYTNSNQTVALTLLCRNEWG